MTSSFRLIAFILAISTSAALAAVKPNSLFTDHMVLQQGQPVPVWGTASPGEKISVVLGNRGRAETKTGPDGRWMATLPPLQVSNQPAELVIRGENEVRIQDVLVGEVWVGSGQSNMAMSVNNTWDAARVKQAAGEGRFSNIRLFTVAWTASDEPQIDSGAQWRTITPSTLGSFSATLFYFGEALRGAMPDTPIGLIASCVGGTNAHAWLPKHVFDTALGAKSVRDWYQSQLALLPTRDPIYDEALKAYEERTNALKQAGQPLPRELQRPPEPPMGPRSKRRPASLYNGMVAPLIPYAMRGVLWYQGEDNASVHWAASYADLMDALIEGWRAEWARAAGASESRDFPFYIAQLPNFQTPNAWPLLREQQLKISRRTPNTAVAVLIDCGDSTDIHPANKTPVGQRLALLARAHTYGEKLVAESPEMKSVSFTNGKAIVEFDQEGLQSRDGQPLRNFEIAGADHQFHPAQAEIKANKIILQSANVAEPVAVRYAWANNPENINFTNSAGLPASPFRTDDWSWAPSKPVSPSRP